MPQNCPYVRDCIDKFIAQRLPRYPAHIRKEVRKELLHYKKNLSKAKQNHAARAKRKGHAATWPEREQVLRDYMIVHGNGNPDNLDNQQIARRRNMDGGRLSELKHGKYNRDGKPMAEFNEKARELREQLAQEMFGCDWETWVESTQYDL